MKNILVLKGGGGTEHDISLVSAQFIEDTLKSFFDGSIHTVEIKKDGTWINQENQECELRKNKELTTPSSNHLIDYVIPCIHGPPGETGEVQAYLDLIGLNYMGPGAEGSQLCWNKLTTKLWFDCLNIPNVEFLALTDSSASSLEKAKHFFKKHQDVFVKATDQGSSVGCYHVTEESKLSDSVIDAFNYSSFVLLERTIKGRELEVAVFKYNEEIIATNPGEIVCPSGFYDYEEKYSKTSQTKTLTEAPDLSDHKKEEMKAMALKAFSQLKLKDLARVDFFLTEDGHFYINEINTFPGMTPISMFPKMMENYGVNFRDYLKGLIQSP